MSQAPRRSNLANPPTSTTSASSFRSYSQFVATLTTDMLMSLDSDMITKACPSFEEVIRRHRLTPFQLFLGLVPSGMSLDVFGDLREQLLRAVHSEFMLDLPALVLLSPGSTSDDIKAFLQLSTSTPARLTHFLTASLLRITSLESWAPNSKRRTLN